MDALSTITDINGNLLPSKIVSDDLNLPVLKISLPQLYEIQKKINDGDDDLSGGDDDLSDGGGDYDYDDDLSDNDDDDINEANQYNKPNFYVQFLATCSDIDGNTVEKLVTFNFQTEDIYNEHMESGFEECDTYFEDSININHPGCNYEYEWDEYKIYAEEYPDPDDMTIIDIY